MNFLAIGPDINLTTTTTASSSTSYICQVTANGIAAAGSNCNILKAYFAPPAWYTDLYIGLILVVVVVTGGFVGYAWKNYPMGRFFWGKKGIKALIKFHGAPGRWGILTPYLDKVFLFTSSGSDRKKTKIVRLIPAVPDAVTHLAQMDGGDSFVFIDGDKGLPVSAELEEWSSKNLNSLAESHDWNHFALTAKLASLRREISMTGVFPKAVDWNPGTALVNLQMRDGRMLQKMAKECSPEEREWHVKRASQAELDAKEAEQQMKKTEAILNGEDHYMNGSDRVGLPPRKKTEWVKIITDEIAQGANEVYGALLGGTIVTGQYVADVLSNVADGIYMDGAKAEIEEKVRKELKKKGDDIIKLAIAAVIVMGGIGIILLIVQKGVA